MNSVNGGNRNISRTAELCFARAMRIVPQPRRFDAALWLAHATLPLLRQTEAYHEQHIKKFHRPREIALHLLLNALTKNGTAFDPRITVNGFEVFSDAYARGRGVLVIGHHAALSLFMVRYFYDKGLAPIVITPDRRLRAGGTRATVRTMQPSATFLVKLRSKLRRGELVCGMPDRGAHHARRTVEFAIPSGRVILAPAIIQVAARCQAEVLFTEVHLEGRRLVATITRPSATTAETITEEFISFVREHSLERSTSDYTKISGSRSTDGLNSPDGTGLATPQFDLPK